MSKTLVVFAAVLGCATSAWAQDGWIERLKERLELTDEQATKIRDITQQNREAEEKLQQERDDKIRELLTDEQRRRYEEMRQEGGRRGGPGMGMGWAERFLAPAIDAVKRELELTEEQAAKVKPLLDEFNEKARARFEELRQAGRRGLNWQEEVQRFQEGVKELAEKMKEHVTDGQKEKLDRLMGERFNFDRAGGPRRGRPNPEERTRRAMETLKVEDAEEAAAVREAVKKVVEAQEALDEWERDARARVEELARKTDVPEEEIGAKLEELRAARRDKDKALKDAQKELYEIVTSRQEVELIRMGILR
ncbi:MAG: hypothetical protein HYY16_18390 [Planctomycetes bacterium]|nr:hypothetical protein [Planctomycetota bacterium]